MDSSIGTRASSAGCRQSFYSEWPIWLWTLILSRGQWPCSILTIFLCPYPGVLLLSLASRWQERPGKNNVNERLNEVSLYLVGLPR